MQGEKWLPIEALQLTPEDIGLEPPRLQVGEKKMYLANGYCWGFIEYPDKPEITHLRQYTPRQGLDIGIMQMGKDPLSKARGLFINDVYPCNMPLEYIEVKGDPEGLTNDAVTYEQRIDETSTTPKLLYRYSTKHTHVIEGKIFDLTYDYMPYAMLVNSGGPLGESAYMHQHSIIKGTFNGKPITYLGGWDRIFTPFVPETVTGSESDDFSPGKACPMLLFSGVHPDGCREYGWVGKVGDNGIGFYCKDGEKPVVTTEVEMEGNWVPLPYANDGTMIFTNAIFRFADKEIHYEAQWGNRGHNPMLAPEKWWRGFSQSGGVWYEGKKPYKLSLSFAFAEVRNALGDKINDYIKK